VKQIRLQRGNLEAAQIRDKEKNFDYYSRLFQIVNKIRRGGEKMEDIRVKKKLLKSLTSKFEHMVAAIEKSKNLEISIEELLGSLQFMSKTCKRKLVL